MSLLLLFGGVQPPTLPPNPPPPAGVAFSRVSSSPTLVRGDRGLVNRGHDGLVRGSRTP